MTPEELEEDRRLNRIENAKAAPAAAPASPPAAAAGDLVKKLTRKARTGAKKK